jgi:parallel beta-helix repeat protein
VAALAAPPAGAAPLACGAVITKDTTLHADLTACPGDGLVVGADGITLDLNGHSITGTGGGGGADIVYGDTENGVDNTAGHSDVTIQNGRIERFDVGVKLNEGDANLLTRLAFGRNLAGVLPLESHGTVIEHNRMESNSFGLYLYESAAGTIVDNELTGNGFGMYPVEASDNLIERNSIVDSTILGMQVTDESNRNQILNNVIGGSQSVGLLLSTSTDNVVEGNRLTRHPTIGLIIADTERTAVRRNTIAAGGPSAGAPPPFAGVWVTVENHDVELRRNSVTAYPVGIRLDGPQTGLVVARNEVFGNSGDGIFAGEGVAGLIDRNLAHHNGDDGIDVEDSGTYLVRNVAYSNGDYGIEAVPGADGGGNVASGNGNPAQCLNVACSG